MYGLFNSELYSDIDVVCANNDDAYKCHKLVLSQSDVLTKLFDPQLTFKVRHSIPVNSDTLVFHAIMYSLGEIYAISGLKQLAKRRFQAATKQPLDGHVIAPAIQATTSPRQRIIGALGTSVHWERTFYSASASIIRLRV
ncbi:hypothetical protein SLS54_002031 [Diplodia seriata]